MKQLRQQNQDWLKRRQANFLTSKPISKEYLEKLKKKEGGNLQAYLKNAAKFSHRPQKQLPIKMSFEDARKIVWRICLEKAVLQKRNFEVDVSNKWIIQQMLLYFIGNPQCAWNLNKGLFIHGDVGVGKSFLMTIFQIFCKSIDFRERKFKMYSCPEIFDQLQAKKNISFLQRYYRGDICFDDLGDENSIYNDYGNHISMMGRILSQRYKNFVNGKCITHVTSNKMPNELPEIYGTRVADRCNELFNFICVEGESRRK